MRRLDRPPPAWRPSGPALPGGRTPRASNSWAMAANVVLPVRRISAITVRVVALALAPCPDLAARALPSWRCWPCRASCGPRLADALPRPLCRYARIILRTLTCTHRSLLVVDRTEQCCGVCLPSFTTRGSASCSLAPMICQQCQHPTAQHRRAETAVDAGRLYGTKEFPVVSAVARVILCRTPSAARRLAISKSLAEIAGISKPICAQPLFIAPNSRRCVLHVSPCSVERRDGF